MYNIYGFGDTDYGKRYFADLYRYDQALDQLLETAVVTIDPSADTESDAVTELSLIHIFFVSSSISAGNIARFRFLRNFIV